MFESFLLAVFVLLINFCTTLVYLYFLSDNHRKTAFFSLPVIVQKLFVFLFIMPLLISPMIQQARIQIQLDYIVYPIGMFLVLSGFLIIIAAFFKIGIIPSLRKKSVLMKKGIYGIVRHPIYSGTLITFFGIVIIFYALVSLIYFPISVILYNLMIRYEEKALIEEYGEEYTEYKKQVTKKIIPFVF